MRGLEGRIGGLVRGGLVERFADERRFGFLRAPRYRSHAAHDHPGVAASAEVAASAGITAVETAAVPTPLKKPRRVTPFGEFFSSG